MKTDMESNESDVPLFVEVPAEPARTNMICSAMRIEWNEVTIHVTDGYAVDLAAELLVKLQKRC